MNPFYSAQTAQPKTKTLINGYFGLELSYASNSVINSAFAPLGAFPSP